MKILYCCHLKKDKRFGGAKVYIENAKAMEELGHKVLLIGPEDIAPELISSGLTEQQYMQELSFFFLKYIQDHGLSFDVIEYEAGYLPFKRDQFPKKTLMVCRSVLLITHQLDLKFPVLKGLKPWLSSFLKKTKKKKELESFAKRALFCFEEADLISVPNYLDKERILKERIADKKIHVLPYGLSSSRIKELSLLNKDETGRAKIAFVGSFDPRKGAVEFPFILKSLKKAIPNCSLKLIGTKGLFQNAEAVLNYFPRELRGSVEVIDQFDPKELPELLKDCRLGIFPSWLESFGFGVVEMLAFGIPVVAYDVPGPCEILPKELLVQRGDWSALAKKAIELYQKPPLKEECQKMGSSFVWSNTAQKTQEIYFKSLKTLRNS